MQDLECFNHDSSDGQIYLIQLQMLDNSWLQTRSLEMSQLYPRRLKKAGGHRGFP